MKITTAQVKAREIESIAKTLKKGQLTFTTRNGANFIEVCKELGAKIVFDESCVSGLAKDFRIVTCPIAVGKNKIQIAKRNS